MPKPRRMSEDESQAAFAEYQANKSTWGIISRLARRYDYTPAGMKGVLDRVEREQQYLKDSRESIKSTDASA